jgi:hypothetical protein
LLDRQGRKGVFWLRKELGGASSCVDSKDSRGHAFPATEGMFATQTGMELLPFSMHAVIAVHIGDSP